MVEFRTPILLLYIVTLYASFFEVVLTIAFFLDRGFIPGLLSIVLGGITIFLYFLTYKFGGPELAMARKAGGHIALSPLQITLVAASAILLPAFYTLLALVF